MQPGNGEIPRGMHSSEGAEKGETVFGPKKKRDGAEKQGPHVGTYLNDAITFEGSVKARESIFVGGIMSGTIVVDGTVTVGEKGMVLAAIHADDIIVKGSVTGDVTARGTLELFETARIAGDIQTPALIVHGGAALKGNCTVDRSVTHDERHGAQEKPLVRFGAPSTHMCSMKPADLMVARLKLLIIMMKANIADYPLGTFRRESMKENADYVLQRLAAGDGDGMTAEYTADFLQKARALATAARDIADGRKGDSSRHIRTTINDICHELSFNEAITSMKFFKVA